ncbi:MAG: type VI secretion system contractile sheath small subunit [Gammaproteobacteria bacterium]|nr:type VI secretion system contractile sheath small subunit [Gammaproteobacteria bacterium]
MSVHKKLDKVRKPRVHITYEAETGEGKEKKELPFVVGVMGDYSGNNPSVEKKALKTRKFVEIENDNFDDVMKKMGPGIRVKVDNTLKNDGSELAVELQFNKMADFDPANIAKQVEPLRKLLEAREKLNELLSKADRSEELEELLEKVLQNKADLTALSQELGTKASDKE